MTDDARYWNQFYAAAHPDLDKPSSFAVRTSERLAPGARVFELGCGNGRDALFFASRGFVVTACDKSVVAIDALAGRADLARFATLPRFVAAEFHLLEVAAHAPQDAVYSRFTLHAVAADEASKALGFAHAVLGPGGRLFIEVRSVKGSLYGKGEPVERDAFIHDGHYRRFVRLDELRAELEGLGFSITEAIEAAGLAIYKDDDPVVIRIEAIRR